jgi:hypothetical protein
MILWKVSLLGDQCKTKSHPNEPPPKRSKIWRTTDERPDLHISTVEEIPGWKRRLYQVVVPKAEDLARQDRVSAERRGDDARQKDRHDSAAQGQ